MVPEFSNLSQSRITSCPGLLSRWAFNLIHVMPGNKHEPSCSACCRFLRAVVSRYLFQSREPGFTRTEIVRVSVYLTEKRYKIVSYRKEDPVDTSTLLSEIDFDGLPESLRKAAAFAGWSSLMPVQARSIPYLLARRNMLIQARTGSGKTGAFLLPMLEQLDAGRAECQALILVPTRELARQVRNEAETLCRDSGLRTVTVYGGVGYGSQIKALKEGAHIVAATPGRALDHLIRGTLNLEHLRTLIFDEADRMLSMGFYPDMKKIQQHLPKRKIHTSMYSATFPGHVISSANEFMDNPEFLTLSEDHTHVIETEHIYYVVPDMDKDRSLVRFIEVENPAAAIIFCNTKVEVNYVATVLRRFGYDADQLSADLNQNQREQVLDRVRKGTLRFLVATDVAARGIDIPELSHVIQYETPEEFEAYIHRSGRTGRAGASGIAVSLVNRNEQRQLARIAKRYDIDMLEKPLPSDEDVEAIVTERLTALLEARLRERDKLKTERSRRFEPLGRSLAVNEDESAIIAMLLDDYYQKILHAPLIEPGDTPKNEAPPSSDKNNRRKRRPRKW